MEGLSSGSVSLSEMDSEVRRNQLKRRNNIRLKGVDSNSSISVESNQDPQEDDQTNVPDVEEFII